MQAWLLAQGCFNPTGLRRSFQTKGWDAAASKGLGQRIAIAENHSEVQDMIGIFFEIQFD